MRSHNVAGFALYGGTRELFTQTKASSEAEYVCSSMRFIIPTCYVQVHVEYATHFSSPTHSHFIKIRPTNRPGILCFAFSVQYSRSISCHQMKITLPQVETGWLNIILRIHLCYTLHVCQRVLQLAFALVRRCMPHQKPKGHVDLIEVNLQFVRHRCHSSRKINLPLTSYIVRDSDIHCHHPDDHSEDDDDDEADNDLPTRRKSKGKGKGKKKRKVAASGIRKRATKEDPCFGWIPAYKGTQRISQYIFFVSRRHRVLKRTRVSSSR